MASLCVCAGDKVSNTIDDTRCRRRLEPAEHSFTHLFTLIIVLVISESVCAARLRHMQHTSRSQLNAHDSAGCVPARVDALCAD